MFYFYSEKQKIIQKMWKQFFYTYNTYFKTVYKFLIWLTVRFCIAYAHIFSPVRLPHFNFLKVLLDTKFPPFNNLTKLNATLIKSNIYLFLLRKIRVSWIDMKNHSKLDFIILQSVSKLCCIFFKRKEYQFKNIVVQYLKKKICVCNLQLWESEEST